MMLLKEGLLALIGLSAGGIIAAGVFAFIVTIGVVVRLIGKTHTAKHVRLFEDVIVFGGTAGNVVYLYQPSLPGGFPLLVLMGLGSGIFVGCLIMSLAETLDSVPVLSRRIRLSTGLQYVILGIAAGKLCGALYHFF